MTLEKLNNLLQPLPRPGLRDIKWKTLYDKWRPMVPVELRKDYFPFYTDPGDERREKVAEASKKELEARKKRSITADDDNNNNNNKQAKKAKRTKK